ncbi:kielin/chordin-like protein [Mizuhopecten yessoensis]|uniref:kielin/chordin-like protein n=1 Tax=Mizuhopecten yessoensis TaxID=6573 RepID=UPI000B45B4A3|nr:kielin/chordin-like protein [Mizuhopecten yessoensis]
MFRRFIVLLALCATLCSQANTMPAGEEYTGQGHCEYRGQTYIEGQKWSEGCELNCVCENSFTGFFSCDKKPSCKVTQTSIPPGCHLEVDPNDHCCRVPVCKDVIGR